MQNPKAVQLSFVICAASLALTGCGIALTPLPAKSTSTSNPRVRETVRHEEKDSQLTPREA